MRAPLPSLLAAFLLLLFAHAGALAAEPSPALRQRAEQLVPLFNGAAKPADMFADSFLSHISAEQVGDISKQITGQFGAATKIERIDAKGPTAGTVLIGFEKGVVTAEMVLEAAPPGRIAALAITGSEVRGDSLAKVAQDFWALPGEASLAVARLDGKGAPAFSISFKAEQPLAVGSTFKLFLLAELNRSIKAGERKWSDVVPLDRRSIQTGFLQSWPRDSPMTIHSLAALMISQSDNTAADTLLHLLGREKVERLLPALGIADPARLRPLLSTREVALLKAGKDDSLGAQWAQASEAERRALLDGPLASLPPEAVDIAKLLAAPKALDSIEWLASTSDLVRVMNWLRLNGDRQTLDILAINPGIVPSNAQQFAYVGYKGGSDTGVINMTLLLQGKDGVWRALSGTWNDPAKAVDENRFTLLMNRAAALLR
jgi:beta-lactamase class A